MVIDVTFKSKHYGRVTDSWMFDMSQSLLTGLVSATYKTYDLQRRHGHGSVKGPAFKDVRPIHLDLIARGQTTTGGLTLADALLTDWSPDPNVSTLGVNIDGHTYSLTSAAPSGCDVNLDLLYRGVVKATVSATIYDG